MLSADGEKQAMLAAAKKKKKEAREAGEVL
jgi:hypothetical protein